MSHYFTLGQGGRSGCIGVHGGHYGIHAPTVAAVAGATMWGAALAGWWCRGGWPVTLALVLAARSRAWQRALCNHPRRHHPCAFQPHEQGPRQLRLQHGGCWRPKAPALVACWWTGLAGVLGFSWWYRCAWHRSGWPYKKFVPASLAAWNLTARAKRWTGAACCSAPWARCACSTDRVTARWLHDTGVRLCSPSRWVCGGVHRLTRRLIQLVAANPDGLAPVTGYRQFCHG